MSHSLSHNTSGAQPVITHFNYNSDMSGMVNIVVNHMGTVTSINVPGEALLYLAAHHLRNELISKLEQMSCSDLLKHLTR